MDGANVRVRAPIPDLATGDHVLAEEGSHYLIRVRRLKVGDRFIAFDPKTRMEADAVIVDANPKHARVSIEALRKAEVIATTELVLVYALAKGDKVDAVVRDATELGATRVILAQTERSIVKLEERSLSFSRAGSPAAARPRAGSFSRVEKKTERWKRVAEQAARQCGRSDPPAIDGVHAWSDALDRAAQYCEMRFCLDPRAVEPLGGVLAPALERGASIAFAIGPEGGLSADEIEIAIARNFLPASLGRFVLRTETVAAAVLGAVRVFSVVAQQEN